MEGKAEHTVRAQGSRAGQAQTRWLVGRESAPAFVQATSEPLWFHSWKPLPGEPRCLALPECPAAMSLLKGLHNFWPRFLRCITWKGLRLWESQFMQIICPTQPVTGATHTQVHSWHAPDRRVQLSPCGEDVPENTGRESPELVHSTVTLPSRLPTT